MLRNLLVILAIVTLAMLSIRGSSLRLGNSHVFSPLRSFNRSQSSQKLKVAVHPSFEVVESTKIEEYGIEATLYSHKKTNAQVISVQSPQDDNKVFGISFRTPPSDSTGLPHILEHSVLCGSRKYPVKEPFVDLLKGSLQNFLNAFTYPDRTCYPVASTNTKDFYNLVNVYLDAVLHPRAISDPMVLQQEGWHYELESPEKPLTLKGVVFNEMKGVYSSPDSIMARATQQALFPDNTYGVDSGGDPNEIPTLTFEKFKNFHSNYYHPSNSRIYFYGNDDPTQRLVVLDEYLRDFDKKTVDSTIKYQQRFAAPKRITVNFPIDENAEPKHMITLNWVLNDKPQDMKTALTILVLDSLLLDNPSSSLRKVLTESNLGESVIGGGLSDELIQSVYSVGLKGVKPENTKAVEDLIVTTLKSLVEKGFEDDAIEAAVNSLEFRLREFNTGSFPRGLSLMLGMLPNWLYDKNPFDGVRFEWALSELKKDIAAKKPVFQELLRDLIISNQHMLTVEAIPDKELEKKQEAEESARLEDIKSKLSPSEIENIIKSTEALKEAQLREDTPEAKATIPRLSLEDIEKKATEYPIAFDSVEGVQVVKHDIQTNGILYTDIAFDFSSLNFEELRYVPLYLRLLKEAGTSTLDEVALTRKIGANTGGISTSMHTDIKHSAGKVADCDDAIFKFIVRGKAVGDKVPVLMEIMSDLVNNANLNNQRRAVEILRESKARKESSLVSSGHTYAASRLGARYSLLGYIGEELSGLNSVRSSGQMLKQAENEWPETLKMLQSIQKKVMNKGNLIINLTGDEKLMQSSFASLAKFVQSLPKESQCGETLQARWKAEKHQRLLPMRNEGFSIPSQVNYVVKAGQLIEQGQPVSGSYGVVTQYLSTGYLWDNVRVVGGAYGGFCRFSDTSGRLSLMSYRDPNIVSTLQAYDNSWQALQGEHLSEAALKEAIVGSIGDLDAPISPDQRGYASFMQYLNGETAQDRQTYRNQVLSTSVEDAKFIAGRLQSMLAEKSSIVVFGSQSALSSANDEMKASETLKNSVLTIENALLKDQGALKEDEGVAEEEL